MTASIRGGRVKRLSKPAFIQGGRAKRLSKPASIQGDAPSASSSRLGGAFDASPRIEAVIFGFMGLAASR